ncbi:MAG: hypothetical protein Q9160_008136 [Pyrenula sp. 1 TL-2023]
MASRTNEQLVYNQRGFGFDPEIPERKRHQMFYMASGSISSKPFANSTGPSVENIAPLALFPGEDTNDTNNLVPVLYVGIRLRNVDATATGERALTRGRSIEADPCPILPQQPAYRVVVPVEEKPTNKQIRFYAVTTIDDNKRANGSLISCQEFTWFFSEYRDDTQTDMKARGKKSTLLVKEQISKALQLIYDTSLPTPSSTAPSTTNNPALRILLNPHTPRPRAKIIDAAFTELQVSPPGNQSPFSLTLTSNAHLPSLPTPH